MVEIKITQENLDTLTDAGFTHLVVNSTSAPDKVEWLKLPFHCTTRNGFYDAGKEIDLTCNSKIKGLLWDGAGLVWDKNFSFSPSFIGKDQIFSADNKLAEIKIIEKIVVVEQEVNDNYCGDEF